MNNITSSSIVIIIATTVILQQAVFADQNYNIPSWIKNNAKWWSEGQIGDSDFVKGIQYLIQNEIITIPSTNASSSQSTGIPVWVKNDAKWWSEGTVSNGEFVKGMQYLVSAGIIQVSTAQRADQAVNAPSQANQIDEQTQQVIPTSCNTVDNGVLPDPVCTPGADRPKSNTGQHRFHYLRARIYQDSKTASFLH